MKKMFLGVVLSGLLVLTAATPFAGEKNQSSVTYAYGASNFWENSCIATHIGFLVQEVRYSYDSGQGDISEASINFTRRDWCPYTLLLFANGAVPVTRQTFSIHSDLNLATLNTTVPVIDSLTGQTLDLAVNLTWTADGSQQHTINNGHEKNDDDTIIIKHGVSIVQPSTLSGSIFLDGHDLIAGQPLDGAMGRGQDLTVTINR